MHKTLQKLEAYLSRDYTALLVQSVYPWDLVIMRAGRCVDSVSLTAKEGEFLLNALGDASPLQPIVFFIRALHQGYWPSQKSSDAKPTGAFAGELISSSSSR
ncbi:hypothetical protein ACFQT0_31265 [Hymenobacter humi]|uniref:Uncharacterized protein n=1 Tax=Hymenobacter humi TaxID=1411620 RepID=A0ABW2UG20_9BACT